MASHLGVRLHREPAGSFEGNGWVAGREVRCLTADAQMLCHAQGYTPKETDVHDMHLLHERLGTRPLPPYDEMGR